VAKAEQPKMNLAAFVRKRAAEGAGPVIMQRTRQSSHVASVGYDASTETLYVEYLEVKPRSGRQPVRLRKGMTCLYKYFNVGEYIYRQAMRAPSIGKFLWRRVYKRFRYMRLGRRGWRGPVGGHAAQRRKKPPTIRRKNK